MGNEKQYKVKDDEQVGGTTAGRIRGAAGVCVDVDRVMRTLFPEVFEVVEPRPVYQVGGIYAHSPRNVWRNVWLHLDKEAVRKVLKQADEQNHGIGLDLDTLTPGTVNRPGTEVY